jgi:hypothetical protein
MPALPQRYLRRLRGTPKPPNYLKPGDIDPVKVFLLVGLALFWFGVMLLIEFLVADFREGRQVSATCQRLIEDGYDSTLADCVIFFRQ